MTAFAPSDAPIPPDISTSQGSIPFEPTVGDRISDHLAHLALKDPKFAGVQAGSNLVLVTSRDLPLPVKADIDEIALREGAQVTYRVTGKPWSQYAVQIADFANRHHGDGVVGAGQLTPDGSAIRLEVLGDKADSNTIDSWLE